jgi:hypothetical protein
MNKTKAFTIVASLLFSVLSSNIYPQNPLNFGCNILTADPSAHVWKDGKMYVYTSHDEECQTDFFIKDRNSFSSSDLINWTDHGAIFSVKDLRVDNFA